MPTIGAEAVYVRDTDGQVHCFLPGDDVPGWAVKLMGDHCFTAPNRAAALNEATRQSSHEVRALLDGPPPHAGAGSGRDTWAAYAASHGVSVEDDWKRDHIIAACREAGVPVE